jgi:hypothetical protein
LDSDSHITLFLPGPDVELLFDDFLLGYEFMYLVFLQLHFLVSHLFRLLMLLFDGLVKLHSMLHVQLIHQRDLLRPHRLAHELFALLACHIVPRKVSFILKCLALQFQYILLRRTGLQLILHVTKGKSLRWKLGRH